MKCKWKAYFDFFVWFNSQFHSFRISIDLERCIGAKLIATKTMIDFDEFQKRKNDIWTKKSTDFFRWMIFHPVSFNRN